MAKKKRRKRKHRFLRGFLIFQLVILVIILGGLIWFNTSGYGADIMNLHRQAVAFVKNSTPDTFKASETSEAFDKDGNKISVMKGDKDVYYVSIDDIPQYAKDAIVSIEDKKFYEHHGVDYQAIIRAALSYLKNKRITQGGSTITQQLARNIFLNQDKTWKRKVEEIFVSTELEKKYSKSQILEFYLNNVYFANGVYGIGAASKYYFSTDLSNLSLSQIAYLCAIPNRPSYYDPILYPDHTITRRNKILKNMLEDQKISQESYNSAISEEIALNLPEEVKHNYAETYTFFCATEALMEMQGFQFQSDFATTAEKTEYENNYNDLYNTCNRKLFTGGYRIYTSLDMTMQQELQDTIDNTLSFNTDLQDSGVYAFQGAAVCIDNSTGKVCAIIGGRSQDSAGYTLNRAFQSYRQPGSSIKPLIVYTPAIERGLTADTIVYDVKDPDGPKNAGDTYSGAMTVRRAVEQSKNTVAYKIFQELTPDVGIDYLINMHFGKISDDDKYPAAALGGLTNGVSPLDMAKGYATLENDGVYRNPTCIVKITDSDGNVVYQPDEGDTVIYKQNAARQMTDILKGVLISGTGRGLALKETPAAAKTGTTNDYKDGWFCGYTRYYTTAVWVGFDQPKKILGLHGGSYPGKIWHDFMELIHNGKESLDFLPAAEENYEGNDKYSWNKSDKGVVNPDGTITYPDGSVKNLDGTITYKDGSVKNLDGTITYPDGSVKNLDGSISHPDGSVTDADGTVTPAPSDTTQTVTNSTENTTTDPTQQPTQDTTQPVQNNTQPAENTQPQTTDPTQQPAENTTTDPNAAPGNAETGQ